MFKSVLRVSKSFSKGFLFVFNRDLNGRFYGGRSISASFYEEEKYKNNQLEPDPGEW